MKTILHKLTCTILLAVLTLTSCSNQNSQSSSGEYSKLLQNTSSSMVSTHRWFYFTKDGFKETDIPRNAPKAEPAPWTQAIRITSSAFIDGQAYFAVNKLGLLQVPQTFGIQKEGIASETKLIKNIELFSKASVADIYAVDDEPVINFFTNTIFEDSSEQGLEGDDPFLVGFNTKTYEYLPLLSINSLSDNLLLQEEPSDTIDFSTIDIREVYYSEGTWNILLKSNQAGKTDFHSLSFTPEYSLLENQSQVLQATLQSIDTYRELSRPNNSLELPQKIHNLLAPVPTRIAYYLSYFYENAPATNEYEHIRTNAKPIQGYAQGLDHCSIAIFEDGTICFAGGLPSKSILNYGETKAFKLPDLGAGYMYGPMALSGSTLIVSWEETSFFETGASGFLAVDMEQVLYQNE